MLSQTLDSIKSSIDTVYVVSNDTEILKELINSQNYIYGVIILILLFIIGFNFWTNHKKIKTELERKLQKNLLSETEKINKNLIDDISVKFQSEAIAIGHKIEFLSAQSFRMIGINLSNTGNVLSSIQWLLVSLKYYIQLEDNQHARTVMSQIIEDINLGLVNFSKKEIYDSICEADDIESIKLLINKCDNGLMIEKEGLLKLIYIVEKGKDNEFNPVQSVK